MRKVYVAGPYRADNAWEVENNIRRAEELGFRIAEMGAIPVVMHSMYRYWDRTLTDAFWLAAGIELLDVCDAICVVANHTHSRGTCDEIAYAERMGKPVFFWNKLKDEERMRRFIEASSDAGDSLRTTCRR